MKYFVFEFLKYFSQATRHTRADTIGRFVRLVIFVLWRRIWRRADGDGWSDDERTERAARFWEQIYAGKGRTFFREHRARKKSKNKLDKSDWINRQVMIIHIFKAELLFSLLKILIFLSRKNESELSWISYIRN